MVVEGNMVRRLVVVQVLAGSNPVDHPISTPERNLRVNGPFRWVRYILVGPAGQAVRSLLMLDLDPGLLSDSVA